MSGLEAVGRKLGIARVVDLSATPFFLRGSGYVEGTLFPWTMSDFSLMDAIESGIVKLPRVPVADNIPGGEVPKFRNLWENIRANMPKKGKSKAGELDPLKLPTLLQTALQALYGHYKETFELWAKAKVQAPPCFIIVCNNTSASKLVYDYVSGFYRKNDDGTSALENGRLELFRNFDEHGNPLARPRTLLIDSEQLESGEALDDNFRTMAADEIDRFKREIVARTGDQRAADNLSDAELLREAMNTVGKLGRLGESIRCVVSVSMLTEGWDANTVTHVLGVRAFGTQLLCEQVIGRALRRQSYDLNENERFNVEYADILGIPFDFTAKPVISAPQPPRETILVQAVSPERDALEISFPRVFGYRVELPEERLTATFGPDSVLELTPALVGPTITDNSGIIGESVNLTVEHLADLRPSTVLYHLTQHLIYKRFRDPGEEPKLYLFGQLKRIAKQWLDTSLVCKGRTYPGQLLYQELADRACDRIMAAITQSEVNQNNRPVKAVLDPYNPVGSTRHVRFTTSKTDRWQTSPDRCHINWVILDSDWEAEFCRVAEAHPRVKAYVKNHNLGFEVPYRAGSESRRYRPDFIVLLDDGHGSDDLLHLVVEIKGYRGEDAKDKKATMDAYWVPGVNRDGRHGRWAFAEFVDVWDIGQDFEKKVEGYFNAMIRAAAGETTGANQ
jgi:type III restriction enzyme